MSKVHVIYTDECSCVDDIQIDFLLEKQKILETKLIEEMPSKVLNNYGYHPELEFFAQPYKSGVRKGFYRWSLNKALDESAVVCYIYSHYSEKDMTYIFDEVWNVE